MMTRKSFLLTLALAWAGTVGTAAATQQGYGYQITAVPDVQKDVCKKLERQKERCFLMEALSRWWDKGSTESREAKRATEELEAERAAVQWTHDRYPPTRYKVRITSDTTMRGAPRRAAPRVITLAVEDRGSDWLKRVRVVASEAKGEWSVREH